MDEEHVRDFADAPFVSINDLHSQLWFIILLADDTGHCRILGYSSKKARRIVLSILDGKVFAFVDAF